MQVHPEGRTTKLSALSLAALLATAGVFVLPFLSNPVAAAPAVQKEWFQDTDCNGHLDAVTFLMDRAIQDDSIRPSDFTITHNYGAESRVVPANGFATGPAQTPPLPCQIAAGNVPSGACTTGTA